MVDTDHRVNFPVINVGRDDLEIVDRSFQTPTYTGKRMKGDQSKQYE